MQKRELPCATRNATQRQQQKQKENGAHLLQQHQSSLSAAMRNHPDARPAPQRVPGPPARTPLKGS